MLFKIIPVLDTMISLYKIKDLEKRFKTYLGLLQDSISDDLKLPIDAYNPMAKEHVLNCLLKLKEINTEQIITETLNDINSSLTNSEDTVFKVVLNVADNIGGAWTNQFTTDYICKFKNNSKRKRGFCTPVVWVDEPITSQLIIERTRSYAYRTLHQTEHGDPTSLAAHIDQEVYVYSMSNESNLRKEIKDLEKLYKFQRANSDSEDYNLIFNFFYGDSASQSLAYAQHGITSSTGFEYCKYLSTKKSNN